MAKIHELSTILADQIAAGEVVERPASVVKELLENALDAHATQIDILLEEAGVKSIQIVDNGDGIDSEDVPVAFRRHATSKIHDRQDLFKIRTLGFRGEALPSIASVADVLLMTSTGAGAGDELHISGGEIIEQKSAAARKGTDITVSDLFFNTPARLKYLRSQATELSKIVDIVNRLAMSYPDVTFHLSHNGKDLLRTAGNGDLKQVFADVYGIQNARKMLAIGGSDNDFTIDGYVSLPELTRASREYISVLINGRYIKNFAITKALIKGYGSKLMVGRFPMAVINIKMDPLLVDVNVHPTKQEVRLSKEVELAELLTKLVSEKLGSINLMPDGYQNLMEHAKADEAPQLNTSDAQAAVAENTPVDFLTQLNQVSSQYTLGTRDGAHLQKAQPTTLPNALPSDSTVQPIVVKTRAELSSARVQSFATRYADEQVAAFGTQSAPIAQAQTEIDLHVMPADLTTEAETRQNDGGERFPDLQYIGQMFGTFLFAQGPAGLYLIDQHAAQERVKYEYYREEIGKVANDQQRLLVPLVLDYPMVDAIKLRDHQHELEAVGLYLEPFGDNTFVVKQHPTWFVAGQEEATIREMVDWLLRDGSLTVAQFRERTAIMMSCKRSIKANWHLDDLQAKALITQLATTQNPFNCPHGRPVVVTFSLTDMEKMFKRIQDSHESWVEYDNHPY